MNKKLISALAAAGIIALTGCGSDSSSSGAPTYTRVAPLAAQTATISIADPAGTPVVTITSQPADIELSGTAVAVSGTNTTLSLTATNNTGRLLFGAKAVVNTVTDATGTNAVSWFATGTTNDTSEQFASFGPKAIDIGASAKAEDDISLTDLDGLDDPLVITVTLPTEEVVAYGSSSQGGTPTYEIQDVNGALELVDADVASYANYAAGDGGLLGGVSSLDGRHIYWGSRNSSQVTVLDTVTLKTSGIKLSDASVGTVGGVTMSSDGRYLYAAYSLGSHRYCYSYNENLSSHVAKIDLSSNTVVETVDLPVISSSMYPATIKHVALSGDESTLAVVAASSCSSATGGQMFIIDAGDMAVTGDALAAVETPRYVALNDDASTLYYVSNDDASVIFTTDTATGDRSAISLTNGSGSSPRYLGFGPDSRLYYLRNTATDGLAILDVSTATPTEVVVDTVGTPEEMSFDLDGDKYYINESSGTSIWDITNDTELQAASGVSSIAKHSYVTSAY